ncbi:hypothetical protein E2C01_070314 [Portunus trituberculatus]|uniref:Uncharacterized protein n=1 Tax=Portunus trituberculatus TaxID=210409 RepID=A0A5B7I523_PORTR|nr:hypothetical protein [Portunus trituberculatus]
MTEESRWHTGSGSATTTIAAINNTKNKQETSTAHHDTFLHHTHVLDGGTQILRDVLLYGGFLYVK